MSKPNIYWREREREREREYKPYNQLSKFSNIIIKLIMRFMRKE